ncbi:alpha-amylase family glycosyl hydrolase [[Mycoplasma] collis]|uniref:alpha-amylase family glycosyl hydrolase n=1 Tax=[Mycoplasma] collis TaxID=2127 RepID=UPI00051B5D61|nr:alpha-amylase family glycosyl hydrolase [[Mycoplasma] collis]
MNEKNDIYYKLNYWYFYDSNSSNSGDYKGVFLKLNYFKKMQINNLIFDSFLHNYEKLDFNSSINKKYGSINDLINLIKSFNDENIEVAMIYDFKISYKYFEWLNNFNLINDEQNILFLINNENNLNNKFIQKVNLNKKNENDNINEFETIFLKILKIYKKIGINKIILKNVDFLFNSLNFEKNKFIFFLNNLINKMKIDSNINFIFEFNNNFFKKNNKTFLKVIKDFETEKYFLNFFTSYLFNDNKNIFNIIKFNKLKFKKIIKYIFNFPTKTTFIFNNNELGKLSSRLKISNKNVEAFNKMIAAISILNKNNTYILQGDEIGQENKFFTYEDFINDKKKYLRNNKAIILKENDTSFFRLWAKHSNENNNTIFAWNSSPSLGFNNKNFNIPKKPKNYKVNNLEYNLSNKFSIYNWYLQLLNFKNELIKHNAFKKNSKINFIFLNKKILKINLKTKNKDFIYLINLSQKNEKYKFNFNKYVCKLNSHNWTISIKEFETLKPFQFLVLEKK